MKSWSRKTHSGFDNVVTWPKPACSLGSLVQVESLTAGRVYGPTLERRLRTSIESLLRLEEWNVHVEHALEQAWLEEAEKRARLEQEKRAR